MDRYKVIVLPLVVLFWFGTNLFFMKFSIDWQAEVEQKRLDIAVNYCADAAVKEMIAKSGDLGLDYIKYDYVNVNPSIALDTFAELLCDNMGYTPNIENKTMMKVSYIQGFCVAAYDGYYIGEYARVEDGTHELVLQPKMPYTVEKNGVTYYVTFDPEYYWIYNPTTATKEKFKNQGTITIDEIQIAINETLTDAFTKSVWRNTNGAVKGMIRFPGVKSSVSRTNPIEGVTVIAYVKGEDSRGSTLSSVGIGGSKVGHANYYIGYKKNGMKMYVDVNVNLRPEDFNNKTEYFNSALEAAQAGYYFDLSYY